MSSHGLDLKKAFYRILGVASIIKIRRRVSPNWNGEMADAAEVASAASAGLE
jgi:hypothetical protein